MNQEVFDAARTGNLAGIPDTLPRNQAVLASKWTPLHIACLLGKKEFAEAFLRKYPEYYTVENPDDCNALHLASSTGQFETVELLLAFRLPENLAVDKRELCIKKDTDGRTPLHHAVINGSFRIAKRLLEACPESALVVTHLRETVFHLAVKNKESPSVDLFKTLLEGPYTECILQLADRDGNTVLHLAVARKQIEIVKLLANDEHISTLQVNAVNSSALTALDVLVIDYMNKTDRKIETAIISQGGIRLNESCEQRENSKSMTSGLFLMASLIAAGCLQIAVNLQDSFRTTDAYATLMATDGIALFLSLCLILSLLLPTKAKYEFLKWVWLRLLAYLTVIMFILVFIRLVSYRTNDWKTFYHVPVRSPYFLPLFFLGGLMGYLIRF